jgi:DNA-binding transcriptional LysR family regulator
LLGSNLPLTLDRVDVDQLRLYCTVVECGGFAGAQAQLNVSAAAISMKMSSLERRLGMRLCHRGRMGFRLTEEGERVYAAARELFRAHGAFLTKIGGLHVDLVGDLVIGVIDSTVTHPQMRLSQVIDRFRRRSRNVHLTLIIGEPSQIERSLLDGVVHVGIAPFYHHVPTLRYEPLFDERHELHCGRSHPFFPRAPTEIDASELDGQDYVVRGYIPRTTELSVDIVHWAAKVFDMEAMLHLVLSGRFIGYMPMHFCERWLMSGELRPIRPDIFAHMSTFEVATRLEPAEPRLVQAFLEDLKAMLQPG